MLAQMMKTLERIRRMTHEEVATYSCLRVWQAENEAGTHFSYMNAGFVAEFHLPLDRDQRRFATRVLDFVELDAAVRGAQLDVPGFVEDLERAVREYME